MRHWLQAVAGTALASAVLTIAVVVTPSLHLAYRALGVHAAVESGAAMAALLAAVLAFGRVRTRSTASSDLLLTWALGMLVVAAVFRVLASAVETLAHGKLVPWDGRLLDLAGALLVALAAWLPLRAVRGRTARPAWIAGGLGAAVLVTTILVRSFESRLSSPSTVASNAGTLGWPNFNGQALLLGIHASAACLYGVAAAGFLRSARRRRDDYLAWLGLACVLALFSGVNYALFPTRYTAYVYTGDGFRILFFVVLAVGAFRELGSYWQSLVTTAIGEERRRIARNLHDGVAQEIAYIARNLDALSAADSEEAGQLRRLRRAAGRAERESRQALAVLSAPPDEPFGHVLVRSVKEVAERLGIAVEFELAEDVRLSPTRVEALVRIAGEAVANAARHSGAPVVRLRLEYVGSRVRLQVRDGGCGFELGEAVTSGRFGLVSMRERAQAVGALLQVVTAPGSGTAVEVVC